MKVFRVQGKFRMGHIMNAPFTLEVIGADDHGARDTIFATLGSRHRVNRHQVWIEKVTEIKPDQITDPAVEKKLSLVK
ncbi:MAG: large subunit ribosomal protein [Thermoplasmata archaeon]|jgi:ribosomal protein L20A (L18A)|nr:large subunit ribosomal protein [Thermoplasmata archaeon]